MDIAQQKEANQRLHTRPPAYCFPCRILLRPLRNRQMRLVDVFIALWLGAAIGTESTPAVAALFGDDSARRMIPAFAFSNATEIEAKREHSLDTRVDVPAAGKECTPSPLWAKKVDPAKYEIGCNEIEV